MFSVIMLAILISSVTYRFINPSKFWLVGTLALVLIYWTTIWAYAGKWGVENIENASGESIRQDSTQTRTRTTFFGAYTRSHMGGGLMGGK